KAMESLSSETDKGMATLDTLAKELEASPFLRWQSAVNAPNEMYAICKKAAEYFEMREAAKKEAAERARQLIELTKLNESLLRGLELEKESQCNQARDQRENEAG
ncbi:hypothetical protein KEM55_005913, partial [Ascosphaera atra]